MCLFYKELDQLFGNRQNVNPFSLLEPIQIPSQNEDQEVENDLSSSLESVHITDETRNGSSSNKKRKRTVEEQPEIQPKKPQ